MPSEEQQAAQRRASLLHTRVPSHGKSSTRLHRTNSTAKAGVHHPRLPTKRSSSSEEVIDQPAGMKRSNSEKKLARNGSTSQLKKNASHSALKRNRSHVEVRRPSKSHGTLKRTTSEKSIKDDKANRRPSVHFDLGQEVDGQDDGWTEASGSTSPAISRNGSVRNGTSSGHNSAKPPASAANSQPQSPVDSRKPQLAPSNPNSKSLHPTPDAREITSRILQRTPSHHATPKMSTVSATVTPGNISPNSYDKMTHSQMNGNGGTPRNASNLKDEVTSRFVGASQGTPGDSYAYFPNQTKQARTSSTHQDIDASRRAKSAGNLTRIQTSRDSEDSDEDERVLAPRSRKTSTIANSSAVFNPSQQSRTQQKLWLQRASSNIEPQQGVIGGRQGECVNGLPYIPAPGTPGPVAGYDGRDPRIRLQLEKTGLEYLVVRRYQDPVGRSLRRLERLPGMEKSRRIPHPHGQKRRGASIPGLGLSQSLRESRKNGANGTNGHVEGHAHRNSDAGRIGRGSYEGRDSHDGGEESGLSGARTADEDDGGVGAMLRTIWDKSMELSASTD